MRAATFGALAAALGFACSQVYSDPITTPFGATFDAGSFVAPKQAPFLCLRTEQENSPCAQPGATCEYGTSPDPTCNLHLVCTSDQFGTSWVDQRGVPCAACPDPATIVDGAPCTVADAGDDEAAEVQCVTPGGICGCTTGPDGAHAHPRTWVCIPPPPDCPSPRPLQGQQCVGQHACDYGACAFKRGVALTCDSDVWVIEARSCD